ncbi:tRNA glutamyl-Q(34) synthetase GluQRS [Polymorphobacter fuscus]|uniref:tRNA glutamyl-Q(34) synthetase GluQRS n=1 Tax=Sandarakinorhabdus fusca TaxID=1439888 RepID=A0A7C9KKY4_9SPHN|nr:tRNA glutamyl-Q(34) synthetase GluQRS [Polymorphobacter fuscus]KAB7647541.1 tRNA glutamyl-Q(34) synthetase GluQRS [Polymorphobacter fuscus]MQT16803.1 tRNA glutamyl-Q(34) synthetase GluQRS [Polymorphobacter fuscus]
MIVTRFAPSPTGRLHRGHALSALTGWRLAQAQGGRFCVRIEDIDIARCRPEHEAAIFADLAWLGIGWETPVMRQSERGPAYAAALATLQALGVVYPCRCSRADIAAAATAPHGPAGPVYPGTCRRTPVTEAAGVAWRIDVAAALARTGPLDWHDAAAGPVAADPAILGDFVVARRDLGVAYALAVVVDDAAQGVTDVVRGADLFDATHGQRLLQALLGLPVPRYHHHPLLVGADGKRLAKRDGAETLASLRAGGMTAARLIAEIDAEALRHRGADLPWPRPHTGTMLAP